MIKFLFKTIEVQFWVIPIMMYAAFDEFINGIGYIIHDITWLINYFT